MTIPLPRRRWLTRAAIPLALIGSAAGLLAYAARESLTPAKDVLVAPVVVRDASGPALRAGIVAQAPGWVEPAPYPILVSSLVEGTIAEVLVLEGEPVERGRVVARLIGDDARLEHARREALLEESAAFARRDEAEVAVAEARLAEVRDEIARKRPLVASGGFSPAELARLELRLASMEREADLARATAAATRAGLAVMNAELAIAALALERTQVRSAASGIVLSGVKPPGTTLGEDRVILSLYDPARLQVRADVPLVDAAKVRPGMAVEIQSEADPSTTWHGTVAREVPEADLQRNTLQYKINFEDPTGILRPEMLVRARFIGDADPGGAAPQAGTPGEGLFIALSAIAETAPGRGRAFIAEPSSTGVRAASREVSFRAAPERGLVEVTSGLRPGDRVITNPPSDLRDGHRLRIAGEGEPWP